MQKKFEAMRKLAEGIRGERQATSQAIGQQEKLKSQYDKTNGKDEIDSINRKIADIQANARAKSQANYEALLLARKELVDMAKEKANKPIDLDNPKLTNALQIIALGKMDHAQATGIVSQFAGDQTALRLLKSTLEEKGITSGVDKLIYDPEQVGENIREHVYNCTQQGGSAGGLINALAKFAKFEGIEFEGMDPVYIADAARKSAGLAPENQNASQADTE